MSIWDSFLDKTVIFSFDSTGFNRHQKKFDEDILSMSFDNNLLTEVKGIEYIVGLGYRFKDVIFSSRLADNPTGIIKSDINVSISSIDSTIVAIINFVGVRKTSS